MTAPSAGRTGLAALTFAAPSAASLYFHSTDVSHPLCVRMLASLYALCVLGLTLDGENRSTLL